MENFLYEKDVGVLWMHTVIYVIYRTQMAATKRINQSSHLCFDKLAFACQLYADHVRQTAPMQI